MKRIFFCIIILLAGISSVSAQSGMPADTVRTAVRGEASPEGMSPSEKELLPDVKNYDGFLLDMGLMNLSTPTLPKFTLEIPDASKDYSRIFQLNPNVTYSQGLSNIFSLSNSRYFSSNPFGLTGFWGSTDNLQMGSFTLKNGMRIHTYGEYDKESAQPFRTALGKEQFQRGVRAEISQRILWHTHRGTAGQTRALLMPIT